MIGRYVSKVVVRDFSQISWAYAEDFHFDFGPLIHNGHKVKGIKLNQPFLSFYDEKRQTLVAYTLHPIVDRMIESATQRRKDEAMKSIRKLIGIEA